MTISLIFDNISLELDNNLQNRKFK